MDAKPETKRYRLIVIGECFLDSELAGPGWIARPLSMVDPIYVESVDAWMQATGDTGDVAKLRAAGLGQPVDLVGIEGWIPAASAKEAAELGKPHAEALLSAIRFRQMRPGRTLVMMATDPEGKEEAHVRAEWRRTVEPRFVAADVGTAMGPAEAAEHVISIGAQIEASPTGSILVDLFLEALADHSPDGSIARLWSLLEILADKMPDPEPEKKRGRDLRQVKACMAHLRLGYLVDLDDAYGVRNDFLHEGKRRGRAGAGLQMELIKAVYLALMQARFAAVDPGDPYADDPNAKPLRIDLRLPSGP